MRLGLDRRSLTPADPGSYQALDLGVNAEECPTPVACGLRVVAVCPFSSGKALYSEPTYAPVSRRDWGV